MVYKPGFGEFCQILTNFINFQQIIRVYPWSALTDLLQSQINALGWLRMHE